MEKLLVSPSPHLHTKTSTKSLMRDVVIALLPAVVVSVLFYGWSELLVLGVSVASCVLLEYLITKYLLKKTCTVGDYSAVVTGVLLALNLPSTTPWWVVFIGAVVAVGVAKMTFGGLGQNLFNPATFRDFVLAGYGNACAITGRKIENALGVGIDVVYIKPRSEGGSCLPSNGLPLTKEYSMLFVQGYFTLSDKYEIVVHPDNTSELLTDLNLRQIRIPPKTLFQPDKDSLSYHREHVFGSFKY